MHLRVVNVTDPITRRLAVAKPGGDGKEAGAGGARGGGRCAGSDSVRS